MTVPLAQSAGLRWLTIGCSLGIVCGLMLPVAVLDLQAALSAQQWRTTRGVVEASGVRSVTMGSGRFGVDIAYAPDVRYRYSIAGRELQGDTVYSGKGPDSEAAARAAAARYPVGAEVAVFYDVRDPARAVLDVEVQAKNYQALLAMAFGLLVAVACLLRFRRLRRVELGLGAAPGWLEAPRANRRHRRRTASRRKDVRA